MASDMFLELTNVKGESTVKGFEEKMDIHSFSFGVSNTGTAGYGGGAGAGRANVSDLSLGKLVDKATPILYKFCFSGKHIDKATLTVRKAGGDKPVEYLKYEMTEVFITSVQSSDSAGGSIASESLSLNFNKLVMTYSGQDKSGAAKAESPVTLDIAENTVS